jgi:hypothetical protein
LTCCEGRGKAKKSVKVFKITCNFVPEEREGVFCAVRVFTNIVKGLSVFGLIGEGGHGQLCINDSDQCNWQELVMSLLLWRYSQTFSADLVNFWLCCVHVMTCAVLCACVVWFCAVFLLYPVHCFVPVMSLQCFMPVLSGAVLCPCDALCSALFLCCGRGVFYTL